MAKQRPSKKPTHSLEELDVREVSIVDRPATQRGFLIVKSEDGGLSIALTEADKMARRTAVAASEAKPVVKTIIEIGGLEKFDPLAVLDDVADDDTETEVDDVETDVDDDAVDTDVDEGGDDDTDPEPITKQTVLKMTGTALSQLMGVVNAISKTDGIGELAQELQEIAKSLDPEADTASITAENARSEATGALSQLMQTANLVKALDDGIEELPEAITQQLGTIAATLNGIAKSQVEEEDEETDQTEEPDHIVFVGKRHEDGDLDLIIKRGAKMKQTRLSKLREAAAMLTKLIDELGGEAADGGGKKKKTTKSDDATGVIDVDAIVSQVTAGVNASIAKVASETNTALNTLKEEIEAISKRMDDVDSTVPDGNAQDDAEETTEDGEPVKKSEHLFANVVGL